MDRLEEKGIVERTRVGRAYRYRARLTAEEARLKAVEKIVQGFFDGSPAALAAHLSSTGTQVAATQGIRSAPLDAVDAPATPVAELPTQNLDERLL
jgi:predicted transcriptional regulator